MKKLFKPVLGILSLFLATSLSAQKKDIVDIAISSEAHSTLVTAVKAADLVSTLKSDGPFTVFAPVNDAFAKLPEVLTMKSWLLLPGYGLNQIIRIV